MIAALWPWVKDVIEALPLVTFLGLCAGVIIRGYRRWMRHELAAQLEPIKADIAAINNAVNNVDADTPPMKARVGTLEEHVRNIDGRLDVAIDMLRQLVGR